MASSPVHGRRGPLVAVAATVLFAFLALALVATAVPAPRILSDELLYLLAGASLAEGDGLQVRGEDYGFGPVYPVLLAGTLALVSDRETAYPLFKIANALLFSLTAVPAYLLARRLLPPWWSVAVAAFSVAIPSSVYVSLVMTESAAYLAAVVAILLIVLAVERPTPPRQFGALAAIACASLTRPQFAVLFVAYVAALLAHWLVVRDARPRDRLALLRLWPTAGAIALGVTALVAAPLVLGTSHRDLLGGYDALWSSYHPVDVARWAIYSLADLELYLAVVPLVVAPIVLSRLLRGRESRSVAFAATFLSVGVALILVTAAFSSTAFGLERLHDRYLFYAVPLWLVVLAVWLHDGLPRPVVATAAGVGLALALPLATPFSLLGYGESGGEVDAVITNLWSSIHETALEDSAGLLTGPRVLAVFVATLVAAAVLLRKRWGPALVVPVAAVALATTGIAWTDALEEGEEMSSLLGADPSWVDDALGDSAAVASLYVPAPCGGSASSDAGLLLTEFFNPAVVRATHLVAPDPSLRPSTELHVGRDGALVLDTGEPLRAKYVLAARPVRLQGRSLARGTSVPLVLQETTGVVRLLAQSGSSARRDCPSGRVPGRR